MPTLVTRNLKKAMVASMVGSSGVSVFGGNLESEVWNSVLCWYIWQEYEYSPVKDSQGNAIGAAMCRYNATVHCVTVKHKTFHSRQM